MTALLLPVPERNDKPYAWPDEAWGTDECVVWTGALRRITVTEETDRG